MKYNRFDQLIDAWEPRLKAAFLKSVYQIRDAAQINLIAERLDKGDIEGALRAVGIDPVRFRSYDDVIRQAYVSGGDFTAGKLPKLKDSTGHRLEVLFDIRNPRAEAWLRDVSSQKITAIVDDQRTMIRAHLRAGMEKGQNPKTVALELVGRLNPTTKRREGGVIGLTTSQEEWVRRYQDELSSPDTMGQALSRSLRDKRFDRTVAKAIRERLPIPADSINAMVRNYRNNALRYRAETIARTEALQSLHQSGEDAMKQAIDDGSVKTETITKVWHSAADKRVRDTHRELNGQSVGYYEAFQSPSGASLMRPGDPNAPAAEIINCRCHLEYRVDFLAGVR